MSGRSHKQAPGGTVRGKQHWAKCLSDFGYYATEYLVIVDKTGVARRFTPNFAQRTVLDKINAQWNERGFVRAIILKARQEGISTFTAGRFFRRVHLVPNQKAMIVAHQKDTGSVLFHIYERFHRHIPEGEIDPRFEGEKGTRLALLNGSQIVVETARDATAGRGVTPQMLHASELGFWDKAEETWVSLTQGIPDNGSEVIIESTANGVGNFFHRMWEDAESGASSFIAIFLPWWIHEEYTLPKEAISKGFRAEIRRSTDPFERAAQDEGIEWEGSLHKLTVEQLAWRRRTIADKCAGSVEAFKQEYPATAREAFLVSGSGFFEPEHLLRYEKGWLEDGEARGVRPYIRRGNFVDQAGISLTTNERGHVRIWSLPDEALDRERDARYEIGADTAEGKQVGISGAFSDDEGERGGRDFSSADVVRIYHHEGRVVREQVAQLHGRLHPEQFAEQLNYLGHFYSMESQGRRIPAMIAVEKNHSSGETVLRHLKHTHNYSNLYYSRQMNRRWEKPTPMLGWVTTKETRMPMLDELAQAVREGTVDIPCAQTIKEMYTFVRGDDGKPVAQDGAHDDRVISLAIALQAGRLHSYEPVIGDIPEYEPAGSATGWD